MTMKKVIPLDATGRPLSDREIAQREGFTMEGVKAPTKKGYRATRRRKRRIIR